MTVAQRISEIINEKGFKQYRVAERASIPPAKFNNMLCGRQVIRAEHVPSICIALGITPNELFKEDAT